MTEVFWFWLLPKLAWILPSFDIGRVKERVYNTRYTLVPTWIAWIFGKHAVFLHHFQDDDATKDFHNHPYEISTAYVLAGGYWEERAYFLHSAGRVVPSLIRFMGATWLEYEAGDTNKIGPDTFHRIELRDKRRGCWTLFVAGKKVQSWGFWDRNTGVFLKWSGKPASALYIDPKGAA